MVKIEFEISQNGYTFRDAIVLPENHGMSDEQIDAIKQKRFDDWYAIVTAPSEEEPIIEEQSEEE